MANVVQFALPSARMYRDTDVPSKQAGTYFVLCRFSTWPASSKYCDAVATRHVGGNASYCEAAGTSGDFVMALFFNAEETLDTGSDTTWRWVVMRHGDGGGGDVKMDVFQADPADVTGTIAITQTDTRSVAQVPDRIMFGANTSFLGDMGGTIRYAYIFVVNRACSDADVEAFCDDPTAAEADADCVFFNDCTSAATIGTDATSTSNFTVDGTPTDITDDDPRPTSGVTGTATFAVSSLAASATGTETITGTGTLAASSLAADASGTATVVITGTATLAVSPLAIDAAGAANAVTGTGTFAVSSLAATAAGTETITGTATLAASPLAFSAAGTETITGTATFALASLTVAGLGPSAYDFAASDDGRQLLDGGSATFEGIASFWAAIVKLNSTTMASLISTLQGQGFTAILTELWSRNTAVTYGPANVDGDQPWLLNASAGTYDGTEGTADITTPNTTYWDKAQARVEQITDAGMMALLLPIPLGFTGTTQGVYADCDNAVNDEAAFEEYAQMLAARFASNPRVVWMLGSDAGSNNSTFVSAGGDVRDRILAFAVALKAAGCNQLITWNGQAPSTGTDETFIAEQLTWNLVYTYGGVYQTATSSESQLRTYQQARASFAYVPTATTQSQGGGSIPDALPNLLMETAYRTSAFVPGDRTSVRKAELWAVFGGCLSGFAYGDERTYHLNTGYLDFLADDGAVDAGRFTSWARGLSVPLSACIPSELGGMRRLIVSANGDDTGGPEDYVAAVADGDDGTATAIYAYVPPDGTADQQTVEVDLRVMSAASRLRWWDPTDGSYTFIAGGVANTEAAYAVLTPSGGNSDGENDFVLVVDVAPAITGTATLAVSSLAASSTGAESMEGTATLALSSLAMSGVGVLPITGTATFAMRSIAISGRESEAPPNGVVIELAGPGPMQPTFTVCGT